MADLDCRLMSAETRPLEDRLIGLYLEPTVFFADPPDVTPSPGFLAEVVRTIPIDGLDILVTRMGGVFTHPPEDLPAFWQNRADEPETMSQPKLDFQQRFAGCVNRLIAEYSMCGFRPFNPVSPFEVGHGRHLSGQAIVLGGGGFATTNLHENLSGLMNSRQLAARWMINMTGEQRLAEAGSVRRASALAALNPSLPVFVAGTYAFLRAGRHAEALIDAWIVVEQIVNAEWQRLIEGGSASEPTQQRLLSDQSIVRKINLLESAGDLDEDTAEALRVGAKHRNHLVHGAGVTPKGAYETAQAMVTAIRRVIPNPETKSPVYVSLDGLSW